MQHLKDKTDILLEPLVRRSNEYYLLLGSLLAVCLWGAYAYATQVTSGIGVLGVRSEVMWGFYITNFVFFIGISHVGALMSAILRLTNADWRKPITRVAEVVTFSSLLAAITWPIAHLGRPDRLFNLLIYPRLQSPLVWDLLCIGTYTIGSTIFLYLPMIPDIAKCRDQLTNVSKFRRRIYSILSLGWRGSEYELKYLEKAIGIMTIIIIPIAISVHTVVSWDFAMQLRTGWDSTIFGPYFVAGALLSGVATVLLVMAVLTKFYHLDDFITRRHFDYIATLLLALDIVLIYFTINEYMVPGYKILAQNNTMEGQWLSSLFWGMYWPRFWFQIIGGLILPAFILALPRTRTITGYLVAAVLVDAGMYIERLNIVVPSLALPQLPYAWGQYTPTWVELSTTAASFAGFALVYLIFTRTFPIISIWENIGQSDQSMHGKLSTGIPSGTGGTLMSGSDFVSLSRRRLLNYGATMVTGFALGSISSIIARTVAQDVKKNGINLVPISNLGETISITNAVSIAKFQLEKPESMPLGTRLDDVRVGNNGALVTLLYVNPNLPTLPMYSTPVSVAILEMADPKIITSPNYLPEGFQRVQVNQNNAIAREASPAGFDDRDEPGQLEWWQGGLHFVILANLAIELLREIAESMRPIES